MIHVSNEVYELLAEELEARILAIEDDPSNLYIEVDHEGYVYALELSAFVFWRTERYPEGDRQEINGIIPVWWEIHVFNTEGDEVSYDGHFKEIKKYIC